MNTQLRFVPALSLFLCSSAVADVVINEAMFDDSGTDDREFVELFNNGASPVDISGWVLAGRDAGTINPNAVVPGTLGSNTTVLNPGGFYVFANAGTLNVNQVVAANFLENDMETVELYNGATLVDAFATETNKELTLAAPSGAATATVAAVVAQTGPGYFGNHQGVDLAGTPLNTTVSLGRFVDGKDTNNNGRDFGLRPATPGTTNAPGGFMTSYTPPDPTPLANGTAMAGAVGAFVGARVIDPTVIDANNLNAISAPNGPGSKAYVGWDPSGGGNGITTTAVFSTAESGFSIRAYLETATMPQQFNASNVNFRGSEVTIYSLGSGDALTNLTDLTGDVGLSPIGLPASESANGFTGYAWVYERVGIDGAYAGSSKLHLVDANDGGDSDLAGNTPLDWTILKTYDLAGTASVWVDLSISIDAGGNGVAVFNGDPTVFSAAGFHSGAFNVGYRENMQQGADGTPDAFLRPATFTIIPEPSAFLFLGMGLFPLVRRRRSC